jgi:hypothetical protein
MEISNTITQKGPKPRLASGLLNESDFNFAQPVKLRRF